MVIEAHWIAGDLARRRGDLQGARDEALTGLNHAEACGYGLLRIYLILSAPGAGLSGAQSAALTAALDDARARGVQAFVRHMTFDTPKGPSTDDIERWLTERTGMLDGWLAVAGYTVPVTHAQSLIILGKYANVGAAGDAELAQRSAGYSKDDQNRRENKFLAEFATAESYINSGALARLGAEHSDANEAPGGLSFVTADYGRTTTTDEYSRPLEYMP